jgi:diaminohydroxyphosphoribosylaminopyrimidine deaminase/5-amino-6-(5-phosphoribosylamino)uracil reductase
MHDNPSLDCRARAGRNPFRVIIDSKLQIPLNAKVLKHKDSKTIIATTRKASVRKIKLLENHGHKVLLIKEKSGNVDLKVLMKELGKMFITSVMIEGGSSISASALSSRIVDKVMFFTAPKIIGGTDSIPSIGGKSPAFLSRALQLKIVHVNKIGEDMLFEAYLEY